MTDISKNEKHPLEDFGGMLTAPLGNYTVYNFRALDKYCREQGVLPKDLSDDELGRFEIKISNDKRINR